MRQEWDKWGWLVLLVVITIGALRVTWGREAFCGPKSEQCLREWMSALSGWAAVAAAVPTIIFLSRQINDARLHHRENLLSLQQKSYAVARRLNPLVKRAKDHSEKISSEIENKKNHYTIFDLKVGYDELVSKMKAIEFVVFENEFGPPEIDDIDGLLGQLRLGSEAIEDSIEKFTEDTPVYGVEDTAKFVYYNIYFCQKYLNACEEMIEEVTQKFRGLANEG
ncbi:UNVERIFIED_ORG: hypothetical protein LHK14_00620 [Roseateles sp. XES5]|nr:hypothetical protein [Roseateles sp. XES5]